MLRIGTVAGLALTYQALNWAQTTAPQGIPAKIIVTVSHLYGHEPPVLTRDDILVAQPIDPLPIINLIPLRGERAGLELFLLVDRCSDCEPDSKLDELRRFIEAQPSTTAVGVAYIKDGNLQIAENPTPDHGRAVKALTVASGSKPASPFTVLTKLIQGWPQSSSRRAVLMISNGVDPAVPNVEQDPSAEAAIQAAQRASVTVYAIYHPSADYVSSDLEQLHAGQIQLAHVAQETGGEAFFWTFAPQPSIAPYLADIAAHLANQYLLEFLASPAEVSGALTDVIVKSKIGYVDLMAPYRVWVPGRPSGSAGASRGKQ